MPSLAGLAATASDIRLYARACMDLALVDINLRHHGLQPAIDRIERMSVPMRQTTTPQEMRKARRYARRIEQASRRHPAHAECLQRSLVLQKWLRSEGYPSVLRIGVLKADAELKAHAWVEIAGAAVNDRQATISVFTPLQRGPQNPDIHLMDSAYTSNVPDTSREAMGRRS